MSTYLVKEIVVRFCLILVFLFTESLEPVKRVIQPEEWWLYKNPATPSYFPAVPHLWVMVVTVPVLSITVWYFILKSKDDLIHAHLVASLGLILNGIITNCIKLVAGRPRPDFFYRCFPDGVFKMTVNGLYLYNDGCTSKDLHSLSEGRKSFPSGHSSFAFATFGFLSLYLAGKLKVFHKAGRGRSLRLISVILPLLIASLIALSRTIDYHHHWQDVTFGSILGYVIMYLSYHHHYPSAFHQDCDQPLLASKNYETTKKTYEQLV